jgi:hypothetical protein
MLDPVWILGNFGLVTSCGTSQDAVLTDEGETGNAGAEGATAPETLRQKDLVSQNSGERRDFALADGITFSGKTDRGGMHRGRHAAVCGRNFH